MTDKITLTTLANINNQTGSAVTTINANFAAIEAAWQNLLSRDGTAPNQMLANIDMNSFQFNNLAAAISANQAMTLGQFQALYGPQNIITNGMTLTGTIATTFSFPNVSGTVVTLAATQTLTNKTYDTAGVGNVFKINGTAITAVTGTGAVVLASSPSIANLTITGTAVIPTASPGDNTTKPASTAFVTAAIAASNAGYQFGGRLTLQSAVPVPTADITAATSIFYAPAGGIIPNCAGPLVSVYNGTLFLPAQFTSSNNDQVGLTLTLNAANNLSGNIYDVFVAFNGVTLTLGTGPAWTAATAGASTRGSGAGTTQLALTLGVWTNAVAITLKNGATSWAVPINQATYLGSFIASANGQATLQINPNAAAGGTNTLVGLVNAYNTVDIVARCQDNTSTWTYGSTTARDVNNSNLNRIRWLAPLPGRQWTAEYIVSAAPTTSVAQALTVGFGVNVDVTTNAGFTNAAGTGSVYGQAASNSVSVGAPVFAKLSPYPIVGFNFVQAGEETGAGSSMTMFGNDFMQLRWSGKI